MATNYRVLNPRNHPKDVRLIRDDEADKEWFEGDEFIKPAGMSDDDVSWLLDQGLIAAVIGGDSG
jgi:hypothetical protein